MTEAGPPLWLFSDFRPGQALGRSAIALDEARLASWAAIYDAPAAERGVPAGLLVAAMMEAYLTAIQPRPPGNIHAAQTLAFGAPAQVGDRLEAEVVCLWKEMRKARGWVGFGVILRARGHAVLSGEIRTIWAR